MDIQDFGDADKARRRRRASRKGTRCHVEKVRGGRYMLLCPHKRPKFISASRSCSNSSRRFMADERARPSTAGRAC